MSTEFMIITEDIHARVGYKKQEQNRVMEEHREEMITNSEKMFLKFCLDNDITTINTQFLHEQIHKISKNVKFNSEKNS